MSSVWWLGWNCMLGLGAKGHTAQNLLRAKECTLNLPSVDLVGQVDKLARLTGSDPVPPHKQAMGYRHVKDKFAAAGLSAEASVLVRPPRVRECPVQLEAVLEAAHPFGNRPDKAPTALAFEVRIVRAMSTKLSSHRALRTTSIRIGGVRCSWALPLLRPRRKGGHIDLGADTGRSIQACAAHVAVEHPAEESDEERQLWAQEGGCGGDVRRRSKRGHAAPGKPHQPGRRGRRRASARVARRRTVQA